MTNTSGKLHVNAYDTLPAGTAFNQYGTGFDSGMLFGLGVGYQFNSWFRADITGEYRSKVSFNGTDFFTFPGPSSLADTYHGGVQSWVGLVNVYADLGTWGCLTCIGAGVGARDQDLGPLRQCDVPERIRPHQLVHRRRCDQDQRLGAACWCRYKVTNNFTAELAYRYLDMGTPAGPGAFLRRHADRSSASSIAT